MDHTLIQALKTIIIKAGEMALTIRSSGLIVEKKEDDSPVTNADLNISNFIYKNLNNLDKNIPIICEERLSRQTPNTDKFWLVDPIDGTKSYIKNMDSFTVNIALIQNNHPIIGLIYIPVLKKLYFTDHQGALCIEQDGAKIGNKTLPKLVSNHIQKSEDFIAVVSSNNFNSQTKDFISNHNFSKVVSIPSSIKLCMIAENSCDVYPKFGQTMEWDIAAGHALINAVGGMVVDVSNNQVLSYNKANFTNPHFLAMNQRYCTEFFRLP